MKVLNQQTQNKLLQFDAIRKDFAEEVKIWQDNINALPYSKKILLQQKIETFCEYDNMVFEVFIELINEIKSQQGIIQHNRQKYAKLKALAELSGVDTSIVEWVKISDFI